MAESKEKPVDVVQLDGLVVLKIVRHAKEHAPEFVTGLLLGMNLEGKLEVTNSFAYPQESDDDNESYQLAMLKALRTVNVDNLAVGWYQSAYLSSWLTPHILDSVYNYQKEIPYSVVLIHDPQRTTQGHLALKAYRLTETFMNNYQKGSAASKKKIDLTANDVLEEIPIKVHNSHLVHAFLYELREGKSMSSDADRLHLDPAPFLEKSLGALSVGLDEYSQELNKLQYYQRQVIRQKQAQQATLHKRQMENDSRRAKGQEALTDDDLSRRPEFKPIPKPNRIESFVASNQITHHCKDVSSTAAQTMNKLYIVEGLHKTDTPSASS
jgi:translation initiation factor 3 subunit H